jgi:uncharacterized OB-fold protein
MSELSDVYDKGLARGELLIQQCQSCGRHIMYPRHFCPFCFSADLGWTATTGGGTLHSFTVLRIGAPGGFEDELPYAVGVVRLDEGVQVLGRLHPDEAGGWDSYSCDSGVAFAPKDPPPGRRPTPWFAARAEARS